MPIILDATPNPVLGELLRTLRDRETQGDRARFRHCVRTLGMLLGVRIGEDLAARPMRVVTPLGTKEIPVLAETPVIATALRAGLPFAEGLLDVYPQSDVTFFGAARVEGGTPGPDGSIEIAMGYEAISELNGRALIFADPMVATASTIIDVHARLVELGRQPARFIVAGLVGWRGAADRIHDAIPNAEIYLVTCDDDLDERGYIVPGLGDAGDLCFGPKARD
ncbi:MAG: uracil phosphoribosyltransferase [Planctomycetota bacterium]